MADPPPPPGNGADVDGSAPPGRGTTDPPSEMVGGRFATVPPAAAGGECGSNANVSLGSRMTSAYLAALQAKRKKHLEEAGRDSDAQGHGGLRRNWKAPANRLPRPRRHRPRTAPTMMISSREPSRSRKSSRTPKFLMRVDRPRRRGRAPHCDFHPSHHLLAPLPLRNMPKGGNRRYNILELPKIQTFRLNLCIYESLLLQFPKGAEQCHREGKARPAAKKTVEKLVKKTKANVRCCPKEVLETNRSLTKPQREYVVRKGFESILSMQLDAVEAQSQLGWILDHIDVETMTLRDGRGKELKFTKEVLWYLNNLNHVACPPERFSTLRIKFWTKEKIQELSAADRIGAGKYGKLGFCSPSDTCYVAAGSGSSGGSFYVPRLSDPLAAKIRSLPVPDRRNFLDLFIEYDTDIQK
ncbi:hypothetical protein C2845_PM03G25960 [Panicum miliaceum]|uniref:Uncharacterized protein n=1 Tax=Panicum miliaceum TaxID=4540 RepID=A0A3L6TAR1_PANMI|nr:hypothetical protein C2845_PM03G25960 [Panicum miliaceum]